MRPKLLSTCKKEGTGYGELSKDSLYDFSKDALCHSNEDSSEVDYLNNDFIHVSFAISSDQAGD